MGEARRAEALAHVVGEALVLAEDDAEHERPLHSVCAASDGTLDLVAEPVADAGDTTAASDLAPGTTAQDHVDPLAGKPRLLVEAVVRRAWLCHAHERLQDRPSRG
jgi:hypothetical protein